MSSIRHSKIETQHNLASTTLTNPEKPLKIRGFMNTSATRIQSNLRLHFMSTKLFILNHIQIEIYKIAKNGSYNRAINKLGKKWVTKKWGSFEKIEQKWYEEKKSKSRMEVSDVFCSRYPSLLPAGIQD